MKRQLAPAPPRRPPAQKSPDSPAGAYGWGWTLAALAAAGAAGLAVARPWASNTSSGGSTIEQDRSTVDPQKKAGDLPDNPQSPPQEVGARPSTTITAEVDALIAKSQVQEERKDVEDLKLQPFTLNQAIVFLSAKRPFGPETLIVFDFDDTLANRVFEGYYYNRTVKFYDLEEKSFENKIKTFTKAPEGANGFVEVPGLENIDSVFAGAKIVVLTAREPEQVEEAKTVIETFRPELKGKIYYCGTKRESKTSGVSDEIASKGLIIKTIADNAKQLLGAEREIEKIIFMDDSPAHIKSFQAVNSNTGRELQLFLIENNLVDVQRTEQQY